MTTTWVLVWASVVVMVAASNDDTPQKDNDSPNYDLVDFMDMGESIPMLFHKLINGDLDLTGSETSLADSEAGIDTGEEQILAAVIQTGSMEERDQGDSSSKTNPYTGDDNMSKFKEVSKFPRKSWILLSYKKKKRQEATASKEKQATTDSPEDKIHRRHKRSKEEEQLTTTPIHKIHRRQKRFTFKQKLRSIAVPLSVFNFLGFLPVRVPGLPYHKDLPSPDYSYYNTMHDVYLPQYRRRKGYYRY